MGSPALMSSWISRRDVLVTVKKLDKFYTSILLNFNTNQFFKFDTIQHFLSLQQHDEL